MKAKDSRLMAVLVILAVVVGGFGSFMFLNDNDSSELSVTGMVVDSQTGELVAPWSNTLVNYKVLTVDKFTGANVIATLKVYEAQPTDWMNPRGDFDEAVEYTAYTSADGEALINREMPGTYFVVAETTGYNTEFFTIVIPDGSNRGDISDYQSNPDAIPAEFALLGTTSDEDFAFALVNASSKTVKDTILLTIGENTEFRGWKVIVNDEEGFSTDTDGNGDYDEGISMMKITVGTQSYTIFDPNKGIDLFDSNDEYTFELSDVVADEGDLVIKVEITADTSDSVGANDEAWGEGEGVLSYIKIYDAESNLFSTVDVTA